MKSTGSAGRAFSDGQVFRRNAVISGLCHKTMRTIDNTPHGQRYLLLSHRLSTAGWENECSAVRKWLVGHPDTFQESQSAQMLSTIAKPLPTADVPSADADWHAISSFALTYPGYEIHGFDGCARIANEGHDGSVDQLRAALFFEQRRWRHFDEDPDKDAMGDIRTLIEGIRRSLSEMS